MQEQEFVVQPMDRRAKRALIAVCAVVVELLVFAVFRRNIWLGESAKAIPRRKSVSGKMAL